jgi:hypothetical protein
LAFLIVGGFAGQSDSMAARQQRLGFILLQCISLLFRCRPKRVTRHVRNRREADIRALKQGVVFDPTRVAELQTLETQPVTCSITSLPCQGRPSPSSWQLKPRRSASGEKFLGIDKTIAA